MARCFFTEDFGFGRWVKAGAEVGVDVIDADEVVLDEDFTFFWGRYREIGFVLEDFCAAGFLYENAVHGCGDFGGGSHWSVMEEVGAEERLFKE